MEWSSVINGTSEEWSAINETNSTFTATLFESNGSHQRMAELVASSLIISEPLGATGAIPSADSVTAEEMQYRDPLSVLVTITLLYSIIFVVGLVGNIITCIVISKNKSMHTATNYYLFNLAITDMLMLLSAMPPDLYNAWYPSQYPFGSAICVFQGLLAETSANVTILTISSFTIERYIAICHPFRQQAMSKLSRAVKFIVGIWIFAFTAALPQACQFGVVYIADSVLCTIKNPSMGYAFEISSFIFFVSPMVLICVLYILIGLKLRQSSRVIAKFSHRASRPSSSSTGTNNNGSHNNNYHEKRCKSAMSGVAYGQIGTQHQSTTPKKSQRRIIKMLIAVVVAFFLCWAPFHAQRLLTVYGSSTEDNTPKSNTFYVIYVVLTHVSGVTFFLSTCINPLLYSVMSYKFRSAFKTTIGSTCFKFNWKKRWSSRTTGGGSSKITTTTTSQQRQPNETRRDIELKCVV